MGTQECFVSCGGVRRLQYWCRLITIVTVMCSQSAVFRTDIGCWTVLTSTSKLNHLSVITKWLLLKASCYVVVMFFWKLVSNFASPFESEDKFLKSHLISFRQYLWSPSRWPCGLRRRSAAAWLLGSRVRIPLREWMFVSRVYMLCCPV
jgi:hypothetical protein